MSYRLTLEATIEATSNRHALQLMAEKLLEIVAKEESWPTPGYLGGFGYPMTYSITVLPDDSP